MAVTSIVRHLHCSHCEDIVKHKVYKLHQWTKVTQIVGKERNEYEMVRYQQFCNTCQTHRKVEVPLSEWRMLLKNRNWEA